MERRRRRGGHAGAEHPPNAPLGHVLARRRSGPDQRYRHRSVVTRAGHETNCRFARPRYMAVGSSDRGHSTGSSTSRDTRPLGWFRARQAGAERRWTRTLGTQASTANLWRLAATAFTGVVGGPNLPGKRVGGSRTAMAEQARWREASKAFEHARTLRPDSTQLLFLSGLAEHAAGDGTAIARRCRDGLLVSARRGTKIVPAGWPGSVYATRHWIPPTPLGSASWRGARPTRISLQRKATTVPHGSCRSRHGCGSPCLTLKFSNSANWATEWRSSNAGMTTGPIRRRWLRSSSPAQPVIPAAISGRRTPTWANAGGISEPLHGPD